MKIKKKARVVDGVKRPATNPLGRPRIEGSMQTIRILAPSQQALDDITKYLTPKQRGELLARHAATIRAALEKSSDDSTHAIAVALATRGSAKSEGAE